MKKRLISTLLVLCITLSLLPIQALATNSPSSGTCGDNLVWTLDAEGTLTISGTGSMYNYNYSDNPSPWNDMSVSITKARISNGVTSIGEGAFDYCHYLTSVIIPETVTSIGSDAFNSCDRLTNLSIPKTVTSIGSGAFRNCEALASVNLPPNITCIESQTFQGCKGLTSITIPYGVANIEGSAFFGCQGLTDITIPSSVSDIESSAFNNCSNLSHVVFSGSDINLLYPFRGCDKLKTAGPIGSGCNFEFGWTDRIPARSFGYSDLVSAIIPNNITLIDSYAFVECKDLTNVTIPDSVTNIGVGAFNNCDSLADVYYSGSKAQWDAITVNSNNAPLTRATIHYNSSGGGSEPSTTITTLYPANGSTFDHASASGDKAFHITFDREVSNAGGNRPELDFSVGTLEVHKASDDSVVYQVIENPFTPGVSSDVSLYGSTSPFKAVSITGITPELDYDTEYYVTMPAGFIKMTDETGSPAIMKGEWTFKTIRGTSAQEYNFSYSLDGGSWSLPNECYTYSAGEKITIPSEMPLKDGYYFAGWSDGNKTYQPGSTYTMPSHDVELTALWSMGPLNLISIARDNIVVTESYTAAPRYTLVDGATVEWTSADPSIAAVDSNGVVTGIHYGKTAITAVATAAGAKQTVSYPVTVNPNYKISFTNAVVHLAPGKSTDLYCNVLPLDGKDHIKFQSDKPEIISVSGNTITAVGEGSATITASFDSAWLNEFPCEIPPIATCKVSVSSGEKLASEFATVANSYVGYRRTEFTSEDQSELTPGNWCGDFVGLCAKKVNISDIIDYANYKNGKPADRYAASMFNGVIARGGIGVSFVDKIKTELPYEPNRASFTPEVGDIVLIDWFGNGSTYDHIGIVYSVNKNKKTFTVIDGNAGDGIVKKRNNQSYISDTFSDGYGRILAIVRPNWAATEGARSGYRDDKYKCPIDVRYLYDGETLDSATEQFEASFGTMERTDDGGILVHLNNYYDVDVTINGTGVGTMDITSTFRDSDGTTSTRKFQGVPITEETIGKLFVYNSAATEILEIYKDNGNTFVEVWAANENSAVSSADKDLTDWYLNGDTSDVEPDIPITPAPTYPTDSSTDGNSSSPTRGITVPSSKGGTVTVSPKSASKGATVTLTATPDKGYELFSITVTDSKGNELELTAKSDSKYTFIMPASAVTVNAVFEKVEPAESTPIDETHLFPFTDVLRTDWFCNAVEYVFTNDLMSGTAPYTFNPQGKMNRAMVWTVLGRMADADVDGSESPWYSKAQTWALSNNVSDGTNPTSSISRQELMTMLWRYIGSPAATADLNKFSDSESVADWADGAMQWAVSTGLIVGDNGRLNPTGDARRCEVATIFMRFCESIAE